MKNDAADAFEALGLAAVVGVLGGCVYVHDWTAVVAVVLTLLGAGVIFYASLFARKTP